ncbi:hypothetical protein GJAV_G00052010 [Gymnothorax javanicus]|nr:hypothetical protein GJAV_G00052010 [Gymnothorax javanicus]
MLAFVCTSAATGVEAFGQNFLFSLRSPWKRGQLGRATVEREGGTFSAGTRSSSPRPSSLCVWRRYACLRQTVLADAAAEEPGCAVNPGADSAQ